MTSEVNADKSRRIVIDLEQEEDIYELLVRLSIIRGCNSVEEYVYDLICGDLDEELQQASYLLFETRDYQETAKIKAL